MKNFLPLLPVISIGNSLISTSIPVELGSSKLHDDAKEAVTFTQSSQSHPVIFSAST